MKVANPKVSVVIPSYNRAEDLRRCLRSLVAQSYSNFEVVVCDDGSTDGTGQVAAEFMGALDIRYETAENFGGPARPRNRGIKMARGQYIAFLDSDDWWAPNKLELSVPVLDRGADLVFHDMYIVKSQTQSEFKEKIVSSQPRRPMFPALLCTGISIPNSSVVVRKELLERVDGITEDRELISVEDYDTWLRLSRITEGFVRIPDALGYYWVGGGNISAASPKQIERVKALFARHIEWLPLEYRSRCEGFLAYRIARIAQQSGNAELAQQSFEKAVRSPIELAYRAKALFFMAKSAFSGRSSGAKSV